MKVVFALRSDGAQKPGGDTRKVEQYERNLSMLGIDVSVVYSVDELRRSRADLCHLVNLDLPLENLAYAGVAAKLEIPVVLSTVSHPFKGLQDMYNYSADRHFTRSRQLRIPAEIGLLARERAKLLLRRSLAGWSRHLTYHTAQQALLDSTQLIFPMAPSEDASLRSTFGGKPSALVPNGMNFQTYTDRPSQLYDVAIVGRVEPRKNTLEVAQALTGTSFRVAFAGNFNLNHPNYCDEFQQVIERSDNCYYLGEIGRPQVRDLLLTSRSYLNASWCEVVSQADMEASALGCAVVSTKHSYLRDFLGAVPEVDPTRIRGKEGTTYLEDLLSEARPTGTPQSYDWNESAKILAKSYESM